MTKDLVAEVLPGYELSLAEDQAFLTATRRVCDAMGTPHTDRFEVAQGVVSETLAEVTVKELLESAQPAQVARLHALQAAHAGAWLNAVPSMALQQRLTNAEFQSRISRWLGLPINEEKACPYCFSTLDCWGAHAEHCMAGGDATLRHNEGRDTIHKQAQLAMLRPELEQQGLLRGLGQPELAGRRPADTLLCNVGALSLPGGAQHRKVALDIGFVNPQALSHMTQAVQGPLEAAKSYVQRKRDHNSTQNRCHEAGIDYRPIVFEVFGGLAPESQKILDSINNAAAEITNTPLPEVAQRFWTRVSIDLQKANHRAWEEGLEESQNSRVGG